MPSKERNPYKLLYMPKHPEASTNGCVYEHRIIAEKILGRKLKPGETIHHIDNNKKNNSEENLLIFATNSDHTAYHTGCEIYQNDGLWYAVKTSRKIASNGKSYRLYTHICPICDKEYATINKKQIYCSIECSGKAERILPDTNILQKELQLYKGNFSLLAKKYNVSSTAIHKYLKKHNLPHHSKDYH